jgi:hypothetical protein
VSTPLIRAGYALLVSFLACVVIALASVAYANHVQRQAERRAELVRIESDRRWCSLLGELDSAYSVPPGPSTELGRRVAQEIHRLRVEFGCPAR